MHDPFEAPLLKTLTAPLDRRKALKRLLFGTGATSLAPFIGNAMSVHAAALGTANDIRVVELTGRTLRQEVKKFEALTEYHAGEAFLAKHGVLTEDRVVGGVQVFLLTGKTWYANTILSIHYSGGLLAYHNGADGTEVALSLGKAGQKQQLYDVVGSSVALKATLDAQGDKLLVTMPGGATRSIPRVVFSGAAMTPVQAVSSDSGNCGLCLGICGDIAWACAFGLGYAGFLAACVVFCGGPEDVPCEILCAALGATLCVGAGGSCSRACIQAGYC
jgi:hypothetical protein